jgi:hypothetical protein
MLGVNAQHHECRAAAAVAPTDLARRGGTTSVGVRGDQIGEEVGDRLPFVVDLDQGMGRQLGLVWVSWMKVAAPGSALCARVASPDDHGVDIAAWPGFEDYEA